MIPLETIPVLDDIHTGLTQLCQTTHPVQLLPISQQTALQACVPSILAHDDKILVADCASLGLHMRRICEELRINSDIIPFDWGATASPQLVRKKLDALPGIRAVVVQAVDPLTCVMNPLRELAAVVADFPETLLVVDGCEALGAVDIPVDAWGIDVAVGCSGDYVTTPATFAFMCLSQKARDLLAQSDSVRPLPDPMIDFDPSSWFSLRRIREALQTIITRSPSKIFQRTDMMACAVRAAMADLDLAVIDIERPSPTLTGVQLPPDTTGIDIVKRMQERYNGYLAQPLRVPPVESIILSHRGYMEPDAVMATVSALERALADLGTRATSGKAAARVRVLLSNYQG